MHEKTSCLRLVYTPAVEFQVGKNSQHHIAIRPLELGKVSIFMQKSGFI